MPGGIEGDARAVRYGRLDVRADLGGCDRVVGALQDQRGGGDLREVGAVVGQERGTGEDPGDPRVGGTEAVRQLLPEFGTLRVPHDHRRHRRRPAEIVAVQRLQQLVDVRTAEAAPVGVVVDVAGGGGEQHELGEEVRLTVRGQDADHRAHRMPDEDHLPQVQLAADLPYVVRVAVQGRVPLLPPGREVRAARTHMVEQHDPEPLGEDRSHQTPHVLVAAEPVRQHDHRSVRGPEFHDVVPAANGADAHRSALLHPGVLLWRRLRRTVACCAVSGGPPGAHGPATPRLVDGWRLHGPGEKINLLRP